MMEDQFKIRLIDLDDHIKKDLELLKQYEDLLRHEDDPRRSAKYQNEIGKLKASADRYRQEYESLQLSFNQQSYPEESSLKNQLNTIQEGINKLQTGQRVIYNNITSLQFNILSRFDEAERRIISTILLGIDESELKIVNLIVDALERSQLSADEIRQITSISEVAIGKLSKYTTGEDSQGIIKLLKSPELENKHKIMLTIPIIPMLLSYETELEIGSGVNISQVWGRLSKRFNGKNQ
jgi:hypothetical protein